jgi:hypothetical protein
VHVDAVSATVDLRSPQLDEVEQRCFQPALMKLFLQPQHGFVRSGRHLQIRNSTFHNVLQSVHTLFRQSLNLSSADGETKIGKRKSAACYDALFGLMGAALALPREPNAD